MSVRASEARVGRDARSPPHATSNPTSAVSITVTRAWYGTGSQVADVTHAVQQAVSMQGGGTRGPEVRVRADNGTLRGDPAPGKGKTLVVTYMAGGPETTIFTAEGQVRRSAAATAAVAVARSTRGFVDLARRRRLRR